MVAAHPSWVLAVIVIVLLVGVETKGADMTGVETKGADTTGVETMGMEAT